MRNKNPLAVILICALSFISISAQTKIKTEANADIVEYTNKDGLPTTNFSNIVQTRDGYLWISGIEGTYRFDGYEFEEVGKEFGVPKMQAVYYDSLNNTLYFASPTKFVIFNGEQFKIYGKDDGYYINGLAGQTINFIRADSKGRIWIGSSTPFIDKEFNGGLTKYENGHFTVYDSTNFPLHNANSFIETPYGELIFGSHGRNTQTNEESYIALYKNGVFKLIDSSLDIHLQNAFIPSQDLTTSIDKDGNTWIAFLGINTFSGINNINNKSTFGILMYDGNEFHQYPELNSKLHSNQIPVLVYYSKKQSKVFVTFASKEPEVFSSNKNSIFEFNEEKWFESDFFKEVQYLKNLNTDRIINDFQYLATFFTKQNNFFPELLLFTTTGNAQIQSAKHPNQFFTLKDGKWEKYDAFNGVFMRSTHNGFLTSSKNGFGIYYPNRSRMLTGKDGLLLTQSGIPNLYSDKNGIVWLSYSYTALPDYAETINVGINIWDGKSLRKYTEKEGLKSNTTFNTLQDSKSRVWIPTSKGITIAREIINSEGDWIFKFKNIPNDKRENYNVTNLIETGNGDIYAWQNYVRPAYNKISKSDFYLGKFDGEKFNEISSPFSKIDNNKKYQLIHLIEANDGKLWLEGVFADNIKDLTSVPSKIIIFDGKTWSKPPESWNVPNEQIHFVGKLKNGMYFLTVGGFYNFNGNKFINLSDSVDTNADFRILKGASVAGTHTNIQAGDRLYIRLRNRGLVIFDGINLKFYTKKNGLPSANISNPIVDEKGNLVFGFPGGALLIKGEQFQSYYDEQNIVTGGSYAATKDINGDLVMFYNGVGLYVNKNESKSYPLKLSSVIIDTASYFYDLPQDLSYTENSLTFNFTALNFKDPKQTNYEYILEGYDKDWSRPGNLSFAQYQNLPSGSYTFRVKGITSNGVSTNEASYSFIIAPPFWRTWWAYSLYLIIVGLGLAVIRKYELDRRKERETKKFLQLENDRKTKELEEARQLQLSMLPKELPQLPHLDIAVYMKTATEVGGDYYDFHVHMDGTLTVVLGDATGHGMMSGMMVSIMKSLFMSDRTSKELKPFFENASAAIKDMQLGRLMMALTCVQIINNKLITTNAGMPPLFIYRKDSQIIEEIVINNMPLGAMKGVDYDVKELKIERGDTLLLMSDGFAELKNESKEIYGYKRARNSFEEVAKGEPEEIVTFLTNEGKHWTNNKESDDDVTFVVIKVK